MKYSFFFSRITWLGGLCGVFLLGSMLPALAAPAVTPAKTDPCAGAYGFPDPICASVPQIVNRLIYVALSLAGTIFFVMFLWGGFTWMTAGGEPKKVQAAQTTLQNAVIGMIILATSYVIVVNVVKIVGSGIGAGK